MLSITIVLVNEHGQFVELLLDLVLKCVLKGDKCLFRGGSFLNGLVAQVNIGVGSDELNSLIRGLGLLAEGINLKLSFLKLSLSFLLLDLFLLFLHLFLVELLFLLLMHRDRHGELLCFDLGIAHDKVFVTGVLAFFIFAETVLSALLFAAEDFIYLDLFVVWDDVIGEFTFDTLVLSMIVVLVLMLGVLMGLLMLVAVR